MVTSSMGYVPSDRAIPSPDMSFIRLLDDPHGGWQQRGQYAIWTGSSAAGGPPYRLFERWGRRVAVIAHEDGRPVVHRVASGTPFMVDRLLDHWLTFDSDAMWVDTPRQHGRSALLVVGGSVGKPRKAVVDWTCPSCGAGMAAQTLPIRRNALRAFLRQAEAHAAHFNASDLLRVCPACGDMHPKMTTEAP